MIATASYCSSLPTRPPPPSRDFSHIADEALGLLHDRNNSELALGGICQKGGNGHGSSDYTPSSSQEGLAAPIAVKRVDFSPSAVYYAVTAASEETHKSSPLSKDARPLKSILKISQPLDPENLTSKLSGHSSTPLEGFAKMMQSALHQLKSDTRSDRSDAYLALNGAMQAYEEIPDAQEIISRLDLLTRFLDRDIACKDGTGNLDTSIVMQALKLAANLLLNPTVCSALDDGFRKSLVERSIEVLEQNNIPKPIFKFHMYLLAQQRLPASILPAPKAEKLLTILKTIEERCSGNNVVGLRLGIFKRLLEQCPQIMLARTPDWLEQIFHCTLSSIPEVRARSIDALTTAALVLGSSSHASKAVSDLFDTEIEEGQSYCEYYSMRLMGAIKDKEIGPLVPQIWSAVVLFFRSPRHSLDKWSKRTVWFKIIQKCYNSSDCNVRMAVAVAWNRLVFTVMPKMSTSKSTMEMLVRPIRSGIDARGSEKRPKAIRRASLASYFNLLHYAFRPALTHEDFDRAWDFFVEPILSQMVIASSQGRTTSCHVLYGFLSARPGVWSPDVALEREFLTPDRLPKLDPKWTRLRIANFLKLLEPVATHSMWASSDENAALDATWHVLIQTVVEAGAQEVRTSNDLKEAIAMLVRVFQRLRCHATAPPPGMTTDRWWGRYRTLMEATVSGLGPCHFVDQILATTKDDAIEVASTPSIRQSKHHSTLQSPMVILTKFLCSSSPPLQSVTVSDVSERAVALLQHFVSSKPTYDTKLELLSRSLRAWSAKNFSGLSPDDALQLWMAVAQVSSTVLAQDEISTEQSQATSAAAVRNAVDILAVGFESFSDSESLEGVKCLYTTTSDYARSVAGEGEAKTAMELVAKLIVSADPSVSLARKISVACHAVQLKAWPRSQPVPISGRNKPRGCESDHHGAAPCDPFNHVYALIVRITTEAYEKLESTCGLASSHALDALKWATGFLEAVPESLLLPCLRKAQAGFVHWLADVSRQTNASYELRRGVSVPVAF